jgi:hypothetical protein
VRWCTGALVRWCAGALVHWCAGAWLHPCARMLMCTFLSLFLCSAVSVLLASVQSLRSFRRSTSQDDAYVNDTPSRRDSGRNNHDDDDNINNNSSSSSSDNRRNSSFPAPAPHVLLTFWCALPSHGCLPLHSLSFSTTSAWQWWQHWHWSRAVDGGLRARAWHWLPKLHCLVSLFVCQPHTHTPPHQVAAWLSALRC